MDAIVEFINNHLILVVVIIGVLTLLVSFFLVRAIVKLSRNKTDDKNKSKEKQQDLETQPFYEEEKGSEEKEVKEAPILVEVEEGFRPRIIQTNEEPSQKYGDEIEESTTPVQEDNDDSTQEDKAEKTEKENKEDRKQQLREEKLRIKEEKLRAKQEKKEEQLAKKKEKKLKLGDEGFRPVMRNTAEEPTQVYGEVAEEENKQEPITPVETTTPIEKPATNVASEEDRIANIESNKQIEATQQKQAAPVAMKPVDKAPETAQPTMKPKYKIAKSPSGEMKFKIEGDKVYMVSVLYPDITSVKSAIDDVNKVIQSNGIEVINDGTKYKYVCKIQNKIVATSIAFDDERTCKDEAIKLRNMFINK